MKGICEYMSKERNSAIELLRIIAIIGVVGLHYNNATVGGGFRYVKEYSVNQFYLYFCDNLYVCAVNVFIIISSYFLCSTQKRKLIKIVELFVQVIAFREGFYLLNIILGNETFSISKLFLHFLPINYFVVLYSVLYVLSPYINILIKNLDKKNFKRLVIVLFIIFSVLSQLTDILENFYGNQLMGLSTIGMYGSQSGYTIVNFILLYFITAYMKMRDIKIKNKMIFGIIFIINYIILYFGSILEHFLGLSKTTTWNYNNPFVISFALLIFILFKNIKFNNKFINEMAKSAFTCFLFHPVIIQFANVKMAVQNNLIFLCLHRISIMLGAYLVSYVLYKVYTLFTGWFIKSIQPFFDRFDISVNSR